ncbi:MAG: hypothetical protein J5762_03780 [Clostridia bacterium]|nr:hypothetical protein [Clostridia bacterium]
MPDEIFEGYGAPNQTAANNEGRDAFDDTVERGKEVKCPNCGGNMVFDTETQSLKCEHCGTVDKFARSDDVKEIDIEKAFDSAEKWEKTVVVRCENCGAKIVIGSDEVAKECPYCGTSQIKRTEEISGIKPNAVYPFILNGDVAEQYAKKWAKRRIFAPHKFKKSIEAKNFHGVFEPGFTFDSDTCSRYSGSLGETRTRVVGSGKDRHTETYIHWKHVSGTFVHFFDDVTISATNASGDFSRLLPFKRDSIKVYEKKFLAGFQANHYSRDIHRCWGDAKSIMDDKIKKMILDEYNCDTVGSDFRVTTSHRSVTYKYVLYPVYRLNYNYGNKSYPVAVNGQTGTVSGKTPISPVRVVIAVVLGICAAVALYLLYSNGNV